MNMDRRFKKKKSKKSGKTKQKSSLLSVSKSSEEECVDIAEDIYPIEHYINDREEMINQVFSVMKSEKLQTMIPPILKGMMINELKEKCLLELKEMAIQDIARVLKGDRVCSSSRSDPDITVPSSSKSLCIDSETIDTAVSSKKEDGGKYEHQTLLEVLEQEMERIAYQTLSREEGQLCAETEQPHSDPDSSVCSLDVQVISPSSSSVELVCLDSDDDSSEEGAAVCTQDSGVPVVKPIFDVTEDFEKYDNASEITKVSSRMSVNDNIYKDKDCPSTEKDVSFVKVSNQDLHCDANLTDNVEIVLSDDSISNRSQEVHRDSSLISQKLSEDIIPSGATEESFMVQVFPGKSSTSERVVKKFLRTCELKLNDNLKVGIVASNQENLSLRKNKDFLSSPSLCQPDNELILYNSATHALVNSELPSELIPLCVTVPQPSIEPKNFVSTIPVEHMVLDQASSEDVQTSADVVESELSNVNFNNMIDVPEKEEGEITGDESEDDIELVEVVRDKRRSPTVFLSSDENKEDSDDKNSEKGLKRHKHHRHRHRKHKRNDSPERSRRQIEKRGNRSYRRKRPSEEPVITSVEKSKPVGENTNSEEKIKQLSEDVDSLSTQPNLGCTSVANSTLLEADKELSAFQENDLDDKGKDVQSDLKICSSSDTEDSVFDATDGPCEGAVLLKDKIEASPVKSSWADRWAEKKDLRKVVITSKIYTNVRKKILSDKKKKKKEESTAHETAPLPAPPLVLHVEGSVQEYQMLQRISPEMLPKAGATKSTEKNEETILASSLENAESFCRSPKTENNLSTALDGVHMCKGSLSVGLDPTSTRFIDSIQSEDVVGVDLKVDKCSMSTHTHVNNGTGL